MLEKLRAGRSLADSLPPSLSATPTPRFAHDPRHFIRPRIERCPLFALRRALIDEAGQALTDTIKARLDRLDKRDHARARELALLKEMVLLFVRVWFEYAGPLNDEDPDASTNAEIRFQGFLEMLSDYAGA